MKIITIAIVEKSDIKKNFHTSKTGVSKLVAADLNVKLPECDGVLCISSAKNEKDAFRQIADELRMVEDGLIIPMTKIALSTSN